MKYYYFPVVGSNNEIVKDKYKKLSFITNESYIPYDKCLFSVIDVNLKKVKNLTSHKKDFKILGDSGGYQFITNRLILNDNKRKEIFNDLDNYTDYAMTLDLPPVNITFDESLKRSMDNYEYFNVNQSGKTKFINVIHGNTFDELNKWIDSSSKFNFDGGYSLGGIVTSRQKLYEVMMFLSLMYKKGILQNLKDYQLVHLLGLGDFKAIIPIFYFVNNINSNFIISFDHSNNIVYSNRLKQMILQYSIYNEKILIPVEDLENTYFCNCPVCQDKEITELCLTDNRYKEIKRYAHNHLLYVNLLDEIWNICKLDRNIIKRIFTKQANIFNIIDSMISDKENCDKILKHNAIYFMNKEDNTDSIISVDDLF